MSYANTWREQDITVRSKIVEELVFLDTNPNHFIIKNHGNAPVYASMKTEASEKYHDVVIPAGEKGTMARASGCNRIFFLNTSATPSVLEVTSYYNEQVDTNFIIAGINRGVATSSGGGGTAGDFNGVISGFTCQLPTGSNHIGGVIVDNTSSNPIPTSLHGTAEVYLATLKNDIAEIKAVQNSLQSMVASIEETAKDILSANSSAIGGAYLTGVTQVGETNGILYEQAGKYISYFSNDGSDTIKLALYNTSGNQMMLIDILGGEALSDIPIKFSKFKVWSNAEPCSYRALILAE